MLNFNIISQDEIWKRIEILANIVTNNYQNDIIKQAFLLY